MLDGAVSDEGRSGVWKVHGHSVVVKAGGEGL
jgi:hypothetical protein